MSFPLVTFLAKSAMSVVEYNGTKKALEAEGRAASINAANAYRENDNMLREQAQVAREQASDRIRQANQALSMARLLAAEGVGIFDAAAQNIMSGAATDTSRIQGNFEREASATQARKSAIYSQTSSTIEGLKAQGKAARLNLLSSIGGNALDYYGTVKAQEQKVKQAKGVKPSGATK